jgi:hypothetical protein
MNHNQRTRVGAREVARARSRVQPKEGLMPAPLSLVRELEEIKLGLLFRDA